MMLIGCGFELQNTASFTGKLETLYIKTADPYTIFYRTIKRQMANHGVEIVTESDDSNFVIIIHQDESTQRILSVSGTNMPREYEVYYLVEWSLVKDKQVIIQPMTSSKYHDYTFDQRQLLGKSNESLIIQEALAKDIVQMILVKLNQTL